MSGIEALVREFVVKRWLDLLVFASGAGCLGVFLHGSVFYQHFAGFFRPLGQLASGEAQRRSNSGSGTSMEGEFQAIGPGTDLFNMDALWIPPGKKAVIRLVEGTEIELQERTLAVLKKPFRDGQPLSQRVRVIRGKAARLGTSAENTQPLSRDNRPNGIPDPNQTPPPLSKEESMGVYPAPGAVLFVQDTVAGSNEAMLQFSWPNPRPGFVAVSAEGGKKVHYFQTEGRSSAQGRLPLNQNYLWQVVGASGEVAFGPFRFELLAYDPASVKKAIGEGKASKIQVRLAK